VAPSVPDARRSYGTVANWTTHVLQGHLPEDLIVPGLAREAPSPKVGGSGRRPRGERCLSRSRESGTLPDPEEERTWLII
jgi:hypothetical protein